MYANSFLFVVSIYIFSPRKIGVLLGGPRVGKTTFMSRFNGLPFGNGGYNSNMLGVEFARQTLHLHDDATINEDWLAKDLVQRGLEHMMHEQKPHSIEVNTMVWDTIMNHHWGVHLPPSYFR
jgi:GTPase SAR1 family protein